MIVAAAVRGGAERILTEDLNNGQRVEGVQIPESVSECLTPRRSPEHAKESELLGMTPTTRNTRVT